jgi:hypothetical protein
VLTTLQRTGELFDGRIGPVWLQRLGLCPAHSFSAVPVAESAEPA